MSEYGLQNIASGYIFIMNSVLKIIEASVGSYLITVLKTQTKEKHLNLYKINTEFATDIDSK
ncbi:hypothetical protein [Aquimarina sp. RZ0]|uniref:hypothetical protein n=1 Tax=Aquimarina sp. RZ0 TaxID=2607730 RepID=UPI0011F101A0|nr:hypothetical protein [Aquimarina sp. RZ0]KAA1244429.1 hypothetical protein F0000_16405 [Aquimarina sp. RZ0]